MTCSKNLGKRGRHHKWTVFFVVLLEYRATIPWWSLMSSLHWIYMAMALLKGNLTFFPLWKLKIFDRATTILVHYFLLGGVPLLWSVCFLWWWLECDWCECYITVAGSLFYISLFFIFFLVVHPCFFISYCRGGVISQFQYIPVVHDRAAFSIAMLSKYN
jgi:hypothetical protein